MSKGAAALQYTFLKYCQQACPKIEKPLHSCLEKDIFNQIVSVVQYCFDIPISDMPGNRFMIHSPGKPVLSPIHSEKGTRPANMP